MGAVVEARRLQVHYRTRRGYVRAVDDVSFDLQQGEAFGLVGESGCGKTTLGKALLGVLPEGTRVRGEILLGMPLKEREEMKRREDRLRPQLHDLLEPDRTPILDSRALREALRALKKRGSHPEALAEEVRTLIDLKAEYDLLTFPQERMRRIRGQRLCIIFQDPMTRLDPLMSLRDHFLELLKAHGNLPQREAERRTAQALSAVGIPPTRLSNYPHEFSGGMRQRIMIAMSLVMKPELLIADEPTTSLDVLVEGQILELIEELKGRLGMSLLLITHNLGIVAEVCDRVGVMYAGKLAEVSEIAPLFAEPKHPYTQGLLASVIHLETEELKSIEGVPPDLRSPPSGCRFHPRCPYVMDVCRAREPPMVSVTGGTAACFLHGGQDE